ncbi:unnamed protein product [Schistocephalus solidus]|uniref:AAA+ ATPase domain-containing protein n=1 Tax=Schistocephalus solidus TaxID=70667 RepID=A0A3P7BIK2_SCHSO|nr:unnamed protein product [Schistocephalus solidus]
MIYNDASWLYLLYPCSMIEEPYLEKALDMLRSANFTVDRDFFELASYIDNSALFDDETAALFLSQLFAKLSLKFDSPTGFKLLMYATEHSRADTWLEVLISHLPHFSDCPDLTLYMNLLTAFFTTFSRLTPLYLTLSKKASSLPEKTRFQFLIERTRCLLNLPTVISNALKGGRQPRIFTPELFYCFLMHQLQTPGHDQLNAVLLSQCCLLGQGTYVWSYIFRHICRADGLGDCEIWSSALSLVSGRALESTLVPLLSGAPHPFVASACLSKLLSNSTNSVSDAFRVFHRLLLLRHFVKPTIPINIFGCLGELVSRWHTEKPKQAKELYERTETELGLRILRVWADVTSIQRSSLQQRVYLSQSLIAWVTLFRRRVPDSLLGDINQSTVSSVLCGITAHLSCNVNELRVLGMAVGEWLVSNFREGCLLGENSEGANLKFSYEDNDAVKQVRPLFEPLPPFPLYDSFELSADSFFCPGVEPLDDVFAAGPSQRAAIKKTDQTDLDSDDDPDVTNDDGDNDDSCGDSDFSAFKPLPSVPGEPSRPMARSLGWPFATRKPRYLRECLDGLTASRDEDNEVSLACFAHAEELIYKHKNAVDEISLNFAETLLHTEPPPCPYSAEVNASRHNALVALAVVAPKKTARYLTTQFTQSGLALNQRFEILACLTDAACILATNSNKTKLISPSHSQSKPPQPISDGKTRRFCTPSSALARPAESENDFGPVAGNFFFPLLGAVGRLTRRHDKDPYAHLDDALLSRLVASLGSIYACARTSPKLAAMAEGLVTSAGGLLNHSDAAVRRSSLSALGVVLTVSPDSLFSAYPGILLNDSETLLARRLQQLREDDADHECQELADNVLFALRDKIFKLSATAISQEKYLRLNQEAANSDNSDLLPMSFAGEEISQRMDCAPLKAPSSACYEDQKSTVVQKLTTVDLNSTRSVRPQTVHVEVQLKCFSVASPDLVSQQVQVFLRQRGICNVPLLIDFFQEAVDVRADPACSGVNSTSENLQEFMRENIAAINLVTDCSNCSVGSDLGIAVDLQSAPLAFHIYHLVTGDEADPTHETIEVSNEVIKGGTRWLLPSAEFDGLWESLVYDTSVKRDLLNYSESALVNPHVISWNRVIFLHGPPGTGKTSLCRALAQKLAIRLSHRFSSAALIEINTVNLMSKWFSESARLVSQMFNSIFEYLEVADHLVCLLVDEVESLTSVRKSTAAACEPSDAIRVVNAVLTHLDQVQFLLKRYPNVLVMATSNVTGVLDPAFLDRADIRAYIGPPSPVAIYAIYCSCLNELIRVGLIERQKTSLLSHRALMAFQFVENQRLHTPVYFHFFSPKVTAASLAVWRVAMRSAGLNGRTLRKLPLLAHAFYLDKIVNPPYEVSRLPEALDFMPQAYKENLAPGTVPPTATPVQQAPSLLRFVAAMQCAVEAQFADRSLLEEVAADTSAGQRVGTSTGPTPQQQPSNSSEPVAYLGFLRVAVIDDLLSLTILLEFLFIRFCPTLI